MIYGRCCPREELYFIRFLATVKVSRNNDRERLGQANERERNIFVFLNDHILCLPFLLPLWHPFGAVCFRISSKSKTNLYAAGDTHAHRMRHAIRPTYRGKSEFGDCQRTIQMKIRGISAVHKSLNRIGIKRFGDNCSALIIHRYTQTQFNISISSTVVIISCPSLEQLYEPANGL